MPGRTCIYCRKVSALDFPKEHVIPEAFGRFQNNPTLDCVCAECNPYFGRELEVFLTRDSVEALLRVRYGLKAKSGSRQIGKSRLTCRVISPGDWYGARIVIERDPTGTFLNGRPLPQVAFRKFGESQWYWFQEAELDRTESWQRFRIDADTLIAGPPDEELARLCRKLNALGVVFKKVGTPERHAGLQQMFADPVLDDIIFRGVAKIAFNFLAYVMGPSFAMRIEFDNVREHIRLGTKSQASLVMVKSVSNMEYDDGISRRSGGHRIIVVRDEATQRITCSVSLFDHVTYQVVLSESHHTIWFPLGCGCYFDLQTRKIAQF